MVEDIDLIKNWGAGKILLENAIGELSIREVHLKEDGAIDGTPSLAFCMPVPGEGKVVTQISVKKLSEIMGELGYWLQKKTENSGL